MKYHPTPELLIRYSAGSLKPALSFVVATHVQHCEMCSKQQQELEQLAAINIEQYNNEPLSDASFDQLWQRLDEEEQPDVKSDLNIAVASDEQSELKAILNGDYEGLEWHSIGAKIKRAAIPVLDDNNLIEVLRFAPNAKIPQHTHKGNEYTMILEGAYTDELDEFVVGDFIHLNQDHHHTPVASNKGCVCLAVTDAPMHFTGLLGPVLNLFSR